MPHDGKSPRSVLELALNGLRDERQGCVRRLEAMLASHGPKAEIDAYLRRIDHINAALIRLADTRLAG